MHDGSMLEKVALVVLDKFTTFEFGVVCEVFGVDRTGDGLPAYEFAVVAGEDGPLRSEHGLTVADSAGLDWIKDADLVVVSAIDDRVQAGIVDGLPEPLLAA